MNTRTILVGHPEFANGTLDSVRSLGGQFTVARVVTLSGGETLESLRQKKVIEFWTEWHDSWIQSRLTFALGIGGQVLYLPDLLEGSLGCTYDKVEDRQQSCQEILGSLPKINGLTWIIGNNATYCQILANHLEETGNHLFPYNLTWTVDSYDDLEYGLRQLLVGYFAGGGVSIYSLAPRGWRNGTGLFVLGVPTP